MVKEYGLLCLENPLLDIQSNGDESLLNKYGLKADDAILAEEKHLGLYEDLIKNYDAQFISGGAAQNSARGAQYLLPPNSTVFIGCIGNDDYGKRLTETCQKEGLRVEYRIDETQPTGRCGVIITNHHRSMCTDLGAANHYKLEHLKQPEIWKLVDNAEIIYVGGYHLTVCVPAVMALAEHAAETNKVFSMGLSAPFIPQFFKDQLDGTSEYWDYIIGNEAEALSYAESHGLDTKDIPTITKHLANLPKKNTKRKRVAIITQGTDPTIVAIQGEDDIKSIPVHVIEAKDIVDTTAAGDAFAGGFLAGLMLEKSLDTAVDMGQFLASLIIREQGPTYPFPKKEYAPSQ